MMLCEKLGMTLAELEERMTWAEFELWLTEYGLRSDQCPACGHEARDIGQYHSHTVKCPICKTDYMKVRAAKAFKED